MRLAPSIVVQSKAMAQHYAPMTVQLLGTIAFLSSGAEAMFLDAVLVQRVAEALNYTLSRTMRRGVPVSGCCVVVCASVVCLFACLLVCLFVCCIA